MSAVKGRKTVSDLRPPIAAIEDVLSGERRWIVALADSLELLPQLPDNCIDSVVVDPPYGLEFMGKSWDSFGGDARFTKPGIGERETAWPSFGGGEHGGANPTCANCGGRARGAKRCSCDEPDWRVKGEKVANKSLSAMRNLQGFTYAWAVECLRVLKPGGHLLSFGGTRTVHRIAVAIEDAGFEIRDEIMWMYGSGFPKSMDVSKAIDKAAGAKREVVGTKQGQPGYSLKANDTDEHQRRAYGKFTDAEAECAVTAPATEEAARWQGWGTALKPAHEPIIVARKPIVGTVANNVLTHGTGALNIDATRVGTKVGHSYPNGPGGKSHHYSSDKRSSEVRPDAWEGSEGGRWPANVILTHHESCQPIGKKKVKGDNRPKGKGKRKSGFVDVGSPNGDGEHCGPVYGDAEVQAWNCHPDCPVRLLDEQTSSASRFFYCAKVGKKERNAGLDNFSVSVTARTAMAGREQGGLKCRNCGKWKASGSPCRCPDPDFEQVAFDRPATANQHPTIKPIELMRYLCRLVTRPDGVVLDFCAGSGSTGCGAVMEGFRFIGIEREPEYVKIARARIAHWESHVG